MTKSEHNPILDELWEGVNLNDFREEIKELARYTTKNNQIDLMEKLIDGFPPKNDAYWALKRQVDKAVKDNSK